MGLVFDINEFAVHDGPGIRTSVFFKGCPLRCQWCHNPEGLSFSQEILRGENGCTHCGACTAVCPSPSACTLCGACVQSCPKNLIRFAATEYTVGDLAALLLRNKDFLLVHGGITFSGGEPLGQPDFLFGVMDRIKPLHIAVETSGYAEAEVFEQLLQRADLILLDMKHTDDAMHRAYTGVSNQPILANLRRLQASDVPFEIRIPVIPGVNDDMANMAQSAALLKNTANLVRVELLRYHQTAGAKYALLGKTYGFAPAQQGQDFEPMVQVFQRAGIPVFVP